MTGYLLYSSSSRTDTGIRLRDKWDSVIHKPKIASSDAIISHALLFHGHGPHDTRVPGFELRYVRLAGLEETRSSSGHCQVAPILGLPMGGGRYVIRWVEGKQAGRQV